MTEHFPLTPRAKRVIHAAAKYATDADCDDIGTEHLLAAILADADWLKVEKTLHEFLNGKCPPHHD